MLEIELDVPFEQTRPTSSADWRPVSSNELAAGTPPRASHPRRPRPPGVSHHIPSSRAGRDRSPGRAAPDRRDRSPAALRTGCAHAGTATAATTRCLDRVDDRRGSRRAPQPRRPRPPASASSPSARPPHSSTRREIGELRPRAIRPDPTRIPSRPEPIRGLHAVEVVVEVGGPRVAGAGAWSGRRGRRGTRDASITHRCAAAYEPRCGSSASRRTSNVSRARAVHPARSTGNTSTAGGVEHEGLQHQALYPPRRSGPPCADRALAAISGFRRHPPVARTGSSATTPRCRRRARTRRSRSRRRARSLHRLVIVAAAAGSALTTSSRNADRPCSRVRSAAQSSRQ